MQISAKEHLPRLHPHEEKQSTMMNVTYINTQKLVCDSHTHLHLFLLDGETHSNGLKVLSDEKNLRLHT